MGFLPTRKLWLLLLIISATLISTTSAGRGTKLLSNNISAKVLLGADDQQESSSKADDTDHEVTVHERLLRMNTNDYGRYDPSPSFRRPRHKLIPN